MGSKRNKYYLPCDTAKIINIEDVENYNLKLNRFPRIDYDNKKKKARFCFYKTDKHGKTKYFCEPNYENNLIKKLTARQRLHVQESELKSFPIKFKTDWRLTVGLGCESVYETSILLHHIYGIPYIPGTAIKGVFRSYIISEVHDGNETEALKNKGFKILFGSEDVQGKLIFFDAFPCNIPTIRPDVMTPHYSDYYKSDNKVPADYYDPVVIPFLTVENTTFRTFVAVQPKANKEIKIDDKNKIADFYSGKTPLGLAKKELPIVFEERGIGAKTAVGYGYASVKNK